MCRSHSGIPSIPMKILHFESFNIFFAYILQFDYARIEESPETQVSPNPFRKSMFVTSSADYSGNVVVTIYDKLGHNVMTERKKHTAGRNQFTIDLENKDLPTGLLILEVHYVNRGVVQRRKLMHMGR